MVSTEEQEVGLEQLEEGLSVSKKNMSFLYDLSISNPLKCHTSDDVPNFLMFVDVVLPTGTTKFGVDGKSKNFVIPKARESMVGDVFMAFEE